MLPFPIQAVFSANFHKHRQYITMVMCVPGDPSDPGGPLYSLFHHFPTPLCKHNLWYSAKNLFLLLNFLHDERATKLSSIETISWNDRTKLSSVDSDSFRNLQGKRTPSEFCSKVCNENGLQQNAIFLLGINCSLFSISYINFPQAKRCNK